MLEWFEEHIDEFQLMYLSHILPDLNPIKHIRDVLKQQLRIQSPLCRNTSALCDRDLNIWYNLSLVIHRELVESIPRRIAAVLDGWMDISLSPIVCLWYLGL